MGFIQKDAFRTMIVSYFGLLLGYINRGLLFIAFLTTEQIGLVSLILTVGLLFAQLSNLGSLFATAKFFPFFRNEARKHHGFLPMMLLIVLLGVIVFSAISFFLKDSIAAHYMEKSASFVYYYYWIIPIGIANVFFTLFDNYLRGLYRNVVGVIAYEVVLRIAIMLAVLAYGLHLVSFESFLVLYFLSYFIPVAVLVQYLIRIGEFSMNFSSIYIPGRFRKIIISYSLFSYINTLGALLVSTLDAMMIAEMKGLRATGVYTTVVFLTSALQIPYKSLIRVSAPLVPYYFKQKNWPDLETLYQKVSSIALVMSLFMFLGVWISREEIFSLLKPEYHEGIWVFLFLMIGKIVDMYFGINGNIFVTSKKYKYDILFTVLLLVIVVVLNYFLIPIYGITGAAISTAISYLVYNFGRVIFIYAVYKMHLFQARQFMVIGYFGLLVLLFELLPPFSDNRFVEMGINSGLVTILFIGFIYLFNLEPETVKYIRKAVKVIRRK